MSVSFIVQTGEEMHTFLVSGKQEILILVSGKQEILKAYAVYTKPVA